MASKSKSTQIDHIEVVGTYVAPVRVLQLGLIDRLFIGSLLLIFGGIVLHAPLTVFLSTHLPEYALLIKSWKELLLALAGLLLVYVLFKRQAWGIFKHRLFYAIIGFAALLVALVPVLFVGVEATLAGILANLRYLLFFSLVYAALRLYPQTKRIFIGTFFAGAAVVMIFAFAQVTFLPHDVLIHLGYGPSTIAPYMTVDNNMDYIRINSTLRGPNPLGAYAAIVLALVAALWALRFKALSRRWRVGTGLLAGASLVALLASYSRAAALGAIGALLLVALAVYGRKISRAVWVGTGLVALVTLGTFYMLKDTQFVSQVVLHQDPIDGSEVSSNDEHAESLTDGVARMLRQPLGGGVGSTGSASLLSDEPLIIENQLLYTAHEAGWVGLVLLVYIQATLLVLLWARRSYWLALGVFASGIGLSVIGLVLPVWTDDTVAIIWWGLAAVALGAPLAKKGRQ